MAFICGLVLTAAFALPLIYRRRTNPTGDLFSPVIVVCTLHILTISSFFFLLSTKSVSEIGSVALGASSITEAGLLKYTFVQLVGFGALLAGMLSRPGQRIAESIPIFPFKFSHLRLYAMAFVCGGIGLGAYAYVIHGIGGYAVLFEELHRRTHLLADFTAPLRFASLVGIVFAAITFSFRYGASLPKVLLWFGFLLAGIVVFSSFGGRRPLIMFFILALVCWHYGVRRARGVPWKALLAFAAIVVPFFLIVPILRGQKGGVYEYSADPDALAADVQEQFWALSSGISYANTYIFIVNHFTIDNLWLGRSYLDLLWLDRSSPNKPPIDDGMYISSLAAGMDVVPPMPALELLQTSWPPETLGIMYANFHIIGVPVGMFLLGVVYSIAYAYLRKCNHSLPTILLYIVILLGFHFTNLRIVSVGVSCTLIVIFCALFFGFGKKLIVESGDVEEANAAATV